MEPALDVMSRALQGDPGARSFLERTTSIYVLDVTDTANPKTYGCWNFIHQAMNEVERYEAQYSLPSANASPPLAAHVRLLATMALRVARRSPAKDKSLVATCVSNGTTSSPNYCASPSQSQWLVDLNLELREIVMGRIAAMAFDFSFHRHHSRSASMTASAAASGAASGDAAAATQAHAAVATSAFCDRVVMDTFCAILSANAVASGPQAIRSFATEWIIPSSRNLPAFALASVVLHLAVEAMRKSSPAGTKETLQKLSQAVFVVVLIPTLADAVTDNDGDDIHHDTTSSQQQQHAVSPHHQACATRAAVCFRAIKAWCSATDLSLPQINHICTKANMNIVEILGDSMYSDSDQAIDALAELIESTVQLDDDRVMSNGRMNQVRHLLQVEDEATFRARFSAEQLKTIESREMGSIVDELVSAIGLQRFRFVDRQSKGEHGVCRNLARIGVSVCSTFLEIPSSQVDGRPRSIESGALSLLLKAAAHPSVSVCALALPLLSRILATTLSSAPEILPMLQRLAIAPHQFHQDGSSSIISFAPFDTCGVNATEFKAFREEVLSDALLACYKANNSHYMESCTSAVEEFCSQRSSINVSLQLEAALFCIEIIIVSEADAAAATDNDTMKTESSSPPPHTTPAMSRILTALSAKPPSLMLNALTRARGCRMLRKYASWCVAQAKQRIACDICLAAFMISTSGTAAGGEVSLADDVKEVAPSPGLEAALSLKEFLCRCPEQFLDDAIVSSLGDAWKASAEQPGRISVEARLALGTGLIHVFRVLPEEHRERLFDGMMSATLSRLEKESAGTLQSRRDSSVISPAIIAAEAKLLADEIVLLSGLTSAFAVDEFLPQDDDEMDSEAPVLELPPYAVASLRRAWPCVVQLATHFSEDENMANALKTFFSDLMPVSLTMDDRVMFNDLCTLASALLSHEGPQLHRIDAVLRFLGTFVSVYGKMVEDAAFAKLSGLPVNDRGQELGTALQEMLTRTMTAAGGSLGPVWTRSTTEQGQGQPAFESRPTTQTSNKKAGATMTTSDSLASSLDLMTKCLENCPVFALHLPAGTGMDADDRLLRRSVDAAAAALCGDDPDISKSSLKFLQVLATLSSRHASLNDFVSASLSRQRGDVIDRLLSGICGKCDVSLLPEMAELLNTIVRSGSTSDVETSLVTTLRGDYFLLGEPAKHVTLSVFRQVHQGTINTPVLQKFLHGLWEIHQAEDAESLPTSDVVAEFIRKYGSV